MFLRRVLARVLSRKMAQAGRGFIEAEWGVAPKPEHFITPRHAPAPLLPVMSHQRPHCTQALYPGPHGRAGSGGGRLCRPPGLL